MTIADIDWRAYWRELQSFRGPVPDSSIWDARAESFASRRESPYSTTFVGYLDAQKGESILDMGCGTGEIALNLARSGHDVVAADFSPRMLSYLVDHAKEDGVGDRVRVVKMSWEDDWDSCGVEEDCVDIAVASRSIIVPDLGEAIDKLNRAARKKVAVTLSTGGTPVEDQSLLHAIGRRSVSEFDVPCCLNILFQMGLRPEVRYIDYDKRCSYSSVEEAVHDRVSRICDLTAEEEKLARRFIESSLVPDPEQDGKLALAYKRISKWAFISWKL